MTRYYCDRCHKEIQPKERHRLTMRWSRFLSVSCTSSADNGIYVILCEDCVKNFGQWLDNGAAQTKENTI